ncbi:hypothetical protein [Bacteroides gallinarum]|uniref:hypothetical protein n=1 Tax=Bacteroides gallinarum TaxID=376806 RepID=UPI000468173A|nr:hypothetical protein [Bacteroides gallinarum]
MRAALLAASVSGRTAGYGLFYRKVRILPPICLTSPSGCRIFTLAVKVIFYAAVEAILSGNQSDFTSAVKVILYRQSERFYIGG